ncbi:MAG: amidohydrolase family protein, partial [Luminiphilus sp.]
MRSLCLVLVLLSVNSVYADTLIHAGQLVDVAAGDVLSEQTIRVRGSRIVEVTPGYLEDEGVDVIDLR